MPSYVHKKCNRQVKISCYKQLCLTKLEKMCVITKFSVDQVPVTNE